MPTDSLVLFPDTNFFIECRDPAECPWSDITPAKEITLAVCRSVRSEIDSHKSGRGRITGRARAWSQRLRAASRNGGRLELRASNPRVVVWVPPPVARLQELPEVLDLARPDDRVIADILAQQQADSTLADAAFLTDDGGAADTARHVGLRAFDVPLDDENAQGWRLPREPDGTEKRIRELETRVKSLEIQKPSVAISFSDSEGEDVENLALTIARFSPLLPGQIERLVLEVQAKNPPESDFRKNPPPTSNRVSGPFGGIVLTPFPNVWTPPSDDDIQKYLEADYPAWLKAVEKHFSSLHEMLERPGRAIYCTLRVRNTGTVPAQNAILTIEAVGGLSLARLPHSESDENSVDLALPAAPKAPKGGFVTRGWALPGHMDLGLGLQESLISSLRARVRDRDEFYWRNRDDPFRWQADCEDFRHQEEAKSFDFLLDIPLEMTEAKNAAIKCTLSAANLSEPAYKVVPVSLSFADGDTGAYAVEVLHRRGPLEVPLDGGSLPVRPEEYLSKRT